MQIGMNTVKEVVMDLEAIIQRHRLDSLNDKHGNAHTDYWRKAIEEVLEIAGIVAVAPEPAPVVEDAPVKSAVDLAVERAEQRSADAEAKA